MVFNTSDTTPESATTADGLFVPMSAGGLGQAAAIPDVTGLPAIDVCVAPFPYDYLNVAGLSQWLLDSEQDRPVLVAGGAADEEAPAVPPNSRRLTDPVVGRFGV